MVFSTASSSEKIHFKKNRLLQSLVVLFFCLWISTLTGTSDIANWLIENIMTVAFLALLFFTYKKFKFSDLSYLFFTIQICLHVYGSKYTYAENPFGYFLKDLFNHERNHYDRLVHFTFGALLAYPLYEYFKNYFKWPNWVCLFLPCQTILCFGAAYEIVEWTVATIFFPEQGIAYLGTQGDVWDGQKDIAISFLGCFIVVILISVLNKLKKAEKNSAL